MAASIGSRRELFVDEWLVEHLAGVRLKLHRPERREVAFTLDAPWEDNVAFPICVVPFDGGWRLYYRAGILDLSRADDTSVTARAESRDGLSFTRPRLGLCEFAGARDNNILQIGGFPSVPPAFIDANPACPPSQRFKGIAERGFKGWALASPDGLHWSLLQEEPLELPGHFDTVNTAFWDRVSGCYRCYTRSWHDRDTGRVLSGWDFTGVVGIRAIQHATSPDFLHWSAPEQLVYDDGDRATHLYTNAITPCPGAEHPYLGFPNRYVSDRRFDPAHEGDGVNDALFMSSRDGVHWQRWLDAWVSPGPDPLNWTERNNYPVWGIAQTSESEWSIYLSEHYRHQGQPTRMRRLAVRPWGFVSLRAGYAGGEVLTRPFTFTGSSLRLNARTSAAGSIRVEVQDEQGHTLPGFGLTQMAPWFGDHLDGIISWGETTDLRLLAGRPVRLRFALQDADLFGFRFVS
ncbi:MAG: hypothetical protein WDA75_24260 [Candidatus Latescibacterota bacterium]|jgi:hypothetical protein